jgi:hypothetical protein
VVKSLPSQSTACLMLCRFGYRLSVPGLSSVRRRASRVVKSWLTASDAEIWPVMEFHCGSSPCITRNCA